ncbi:Dam family site-specific DNA-(adenine-N6)-methyltransferase [uncultured Schumannella sp.]|uniref:DNA adenine methylase n=1 Tax=uncultured Schumannella sp. TaxID=1195956 RepID=UPI0025CF8580|nr:Dam family site-specific DNA-(adenine-N6)-methyltransferase [uncultured Schumannella sp.]
MVTDQNFERVDPFLRWAGGKRWLRPTVNQILGNRRISGYIEPFLGGASIFMGLAVAGRSVLADLNEELVGVYQAVRDSHVAVAEALEGYENTPEAYYSARANVPRDLPSRAARFIYLNHTSFNGIHRVNLKGEYNVPFGYRKTVNMPSLATLTFASQKLSKSTLCSGDFAVSLRDAKAGDLVFLDPPYTVAHNANGFVKYNQHLFSFSDQQRLALEIERLLSLGADFILTNAAHASVADLFGPLGNQVVVSRKNAVGGRRATRGRAEEFLFTNLDVSMLSGAPAPSNDPDEGSSPG